MMSKNQIANGGFSNDWNFGLPWDTDTDNEQSIVHNTLVVLSRDDKDAAITCNRKIKYGLVEMDISAPELNDNILSFFLYGDNDPDGLPEITVGEFPKDGGLKVGYTWGVRAEEREVAYIDHSISSDDYTRCSVELLPEKMIFRVNGKKVLSTKRHLSTADKYIIVLLSSDGNKDAKPAQAYIKNYRIVEYD